VTVSALGDLRAPGARVHIATERAHAQGLFGTMLVAWVDLTAGTEADWPSAPECAMDAR